MRSTYASVRNHDDAERWDSLVSRFTGERAEKLREIGRSLCECGISAELFIGRGMIEGVAFVPAWCKSCDRLGTVNTLRKRLRCRACRKRVEVIRLNDSAGLSEDLPAQPVDCPRCGKRTLVVTVEGRWD